MDMTMYLCNSDPRNVSLCYKKMTGISRTSLSKVQTAI